MFYCIMVKACVKEIAKDACSELMMMWLNTKMNGHLRIRKASEKHNNIIFSNLYTKNKRVSKWDLLCFTKENIEVIQKM